MLCFGNVSNIIHVDNVTSCCLLHSFPSCTSSRSSSSLWVSSCSTRCPRTRLYRRTTPWIRPLTAPPTSCWQPTQTLRGTRPSPPSLHYDADRLATEPGLLFWKTNAARLQHWDVSEGKDYFYTTGQWASGQTSALTFRLLHKCTFSCTSDIACLPLQLPLTHYELLFMLLYRSSVTALLVDVLDRTTMSGHWYFLSPNWSVICLVAPFLTLIYLILYLMGCRCSLTPMLKNLLTQSGATVTSSQNCAVTFNCIMTTFLNLNKNY